MKYSIDDAKRITILAGLASAEICLVYYFLRHRNIELLLVFTASIVLLFATVYWINWLILRRVNNFHVCMVIGTGVAALDFWHDRYFIPGIAVSLAGIFLSFILLRRILLPIDVDQQRKNLKDYQKEANSMPPIARDALNLLFFLVFGAALWAQDHFSITPSALLLLIFPLWYAGKIIYRLFYTDWTRNGEKGSVEGDY